jgi:hypothetical protein
MDYIFLTGLAGSVVLVSGAAYPEKKAAPPVKSLKSWLLAVGGLIMTLYAVLGYMAGGSVFFVFLQTLIIIASVLMMLNLNDVIDTAIISVCALILVIWSLTLFEGFETVLFVIGLSCVGLGYAFNAGTLRRNAALMAGSAFVAVFSYLQENWIFFWVNLIFAVFSAYYLAAGMDSGCKKAN